MTPLAVTLGNPSGIGPEIALKAWLQRKAGQRPFFLLADPAHLRAVAEALRLDVPMQTCTPEQVADCFANALPVVALHHSVTGTPAQPQAGDAGATIESIRRAVALVCAGAAAAVVTNPISKVALYQAGFAHPGHTEFLGELAREHFGKHVRPVMMLWSPELMVVPVTIHIALAQVPGLLTQALIVETATIAAHDLVHRFGIAHPRLAVAGLNPHAGEAGSMGREEIEIIAPAIAQLQARGMAVTGPHPADTLFHAGARARYDAVIGMYHDQVLIPMKTLAFDHGVNITLGLPFVRTSPDHGTAFDIAGRGLANPASLIAALDLAARLT